jgi:hypothetical protein
MNKISVHSSVFDANIAVSITAVYSKCHLEQRVLENYRRNRMGKYVYIIVVHLSTFTIFIMQILYYFKIKDLSREYKFETRCIVESTCPPAW